MIIGSQERTLIKADPVKTADYGFDLKNMGQIGLVLQGMYSDPPLAIIREYVANAVDAHAQVGKKNVPVTVRMPTQFSPQFEVEDEGPGLSVADTERLLLGYGASGDHKRTSNDYIGGFGIGCKCALSMVDQFTYTIWHGGMHRIWSSYKNEEGLSKADLVFEAPSNRGNHTGVLVTVPVPENAHRQFHDRVQDALRYFDVLPKVEGLMDGRVINVFKPLDKVEVPSAYNTTIRFGDKKNPGSRPVVVMGGVGYPVDLDKVFDGQMPTDRRMLTERMVIYAPVGTVQLAPSREALQYTGLTRKRLQEITEPFGPQKLKSTLETVLDQVTASPVTQITTWQTLYEGSYSRLYSDICHQIEQDRPGLSRIGLVLNTSCLRAVAAPQTDYVVKRLEVDRYYTHYDALGAINPGYRNTLRVTDVGQSATGAGWDKDVRVGTDTFRVVFLDAEAELPKTKDWTYSAWKKEGFQAGTRESLDILWLAADKKKKFFKEYPWMKELIDTNPALVLSLDTWLVPASDTEPVTRAQWAALEKARSSSTSPVTLKTAVKRAKVAVHSVKLVELKPCAGSRSHVLSQAGKSSDRWSPATISSANLVGKPYVLMDKFEVCGTTLFGYQGCGSTAALQDLLATHEALAGTTVYGLRIRDKSKDYGMTRLDEYLLEWLSKKWSTLDETEKGIVRAFGRAPSDGYSEDVFYLEQKFVAGPLMDAMLSETKGISAPELAELRREVKDNYTEYSRSHGELITALDATLRRWRASLGAEPTNGEYHKVYLALQYPSQSNEKKLLPIIRVLRTFDLIEKSGVPRSPEHQKVLDIVGKADFGKDFSWYVDLVTSMIKAKPELLDVAWLQLDRAGAFRKVALRRITGYVMNSSLDIDKATAP